MENKELLLNSFIKATIPLTPKPKTLQEKRTTAIHIPHKYRYKKS